MGNLKTAALIAGGGAALSSSAGAIYHAGMVEDYGHNFGTDNSLKGYAGRAVRDASYGAMAGLGVYGLFNTSNKKASSILMGVGVGLGAIKGIKNQIYASQHYNSPQYGPGEARADIGSLAKAGGTYALGGAVVGSGIYGGYEVARRIAKGVF